jgi:tRNA G18 (ribose-2'-O)-methylase SpoU
MSFTQRKFLSLRPALQHKQACHFLEKVFAGDAKAICVYKNCEKWLCLPPIDLSSHEEISNRFHLHLDAANLSKKEHNLLHVRSQDKESLVPFLPIAIFLSSLRSAFNVGSILRTTEAFRLGTVYFGGSTPFIDNEKVQKASMGTFRLVPSKPHAELFHLPRPWIALETASPSIPICDFSFPKIFTLILGNEEFGISKEILSECDVILEIPLSGSKNSLNVASAFAIAASYISLGI